MSRFDPEPDKPYAKCMTEGCDAEPFATREEMSAHLEATRAVEKRDRDALIPGTVTTWGEYLDRGGKPSFVSHRAVILNPSRAERIASAIETRANDALDNAVSDWLEEVYHLHTREGVTLKEIAEAVKRVYAEPDWSDAWRDYIAEEDAEEDAAEEPVPPAPPHSMFEGVEW